MSPTISEGYSPCQLRWAEWESSTQPKHQTYIEYNNSIKATHALTEALFNQADCYDENVDEQASILRSIKSAREGFFKSQRVNIVDSLPPTVARHLDLISEKGASCWLTSLPLEDYG